MHRDSYHFWNFIDFFLSHRPTWEELVNGRIAKLHESLSKRYVLKHLLWFPLDYCVLYFYLYFYFYFLPPLFLLLHEPHVNKLHIYISSIFTYFHRMTPKTWATWKSSSRRTPTLPQTTPNQCFSANLSLTVTSLYDCPLPTGAEDDR